MSMSQIKKNSQSTLHCAIYNYQFIIINYSDIIEFIMLNLRYFCVPGLPRQEEFFDELNDTPLSDEDYEHVQDIWEEFNLQTLGDLHDLLVYVTATELLNTPNFVINCISF